MDTGFFTSYDGAKLFFRAWNVSPVQKSIIILHRGHEHSGRLEEFATDPRFKHFNIFSYDQRGNGNTLQAVSPVLIDSVRDLEAFSSFLATQYDVHQQDTFVIANSIAGVIVSAWVHDFAPDIAGMVLLAPAFQIKLYVPFAESFIAWGTRLNPKLTVTSYVKSKVLTHSPAQQEAYNADPLITKNINGRLLIDLLKAGRRLIDDAAAITTPTLILAAGKDYVVKQGGQQEFFCRLESPVKEFITLPGFFHGLLFEQERSLVYDHILRFAEQCFALPHPEPDLAPDRFTVEEHHRLTLNMIPRAERLGFAFQKWVLGKIGFLSCGMSIGQKHGFDSGLSLDYVYKNTPQGFPLIGTFMDRAYLNAIGWRNIRIRRQHLLQLVQQQINQLKAAGQPVKILDIAGGTGNYLFEIKRQNPDVTILINEFKQANIDEGEACIAANKLTGIRFCKHDCFSLDTYAQLDFQPNIVIISGIFELFDDNQLVNQALRGITSISQAGCRIIYTGQPWHPQLKMIAYVLNSHQGKAWVMRRRAQKELDKLFAINGIRKSHMLIDNEGIFTVSCGVMPS